MLMICPFFFFFFFNDTATTEIYTLSLHDALPILASRSGHRPGSYARRAVRHRRECPLVGRGLDRKSTRLNSSHDQISYAVFCLKKKKKKNESNRERIAYTNHQVTSRTLTLQRSTD